MELTHLGSDASIYNIINVIINELKWFIYYTNVYVNFVDIIWRILYKSALTPIAVKIFLHEDLYHIFIGIVFIIYDYV